MPDATGDDGSCRVMDRILTGLGYDKYPIGYPIYPQYKRGNATCLLKKLLLFIGRVRCPKKQSDQIWRFIANFWLFWGYNGENLWLLLPHFGHFRYLETFLGYFSLFGLFFDIFDNLQPGHTLQKRVFVLQNSLIFVRAAGFKTWDFQTICERCR